MNINKPIALKICRYISFTTNSPIEYIQIDNNRKVKRSRSQLSYYVDVDSYEDMDEDMDEDKDEDNSKSRDESKNDDRDENENKDNDEYGDENINTNTNTNTNINTNRNSRVLINLNGLNSKLKKSKYIQL
jgi:hypothetical protein